MLVFYLPVNYGLMEGLMNEEAIAVFNYSKKLQNLERSRKISRGQERRLYSIDFLNTGLPVLDPGYRFTLFSDFTYTTHSCTPGKAMPYFHDYRTSCFDCPVGTFNTQFAEADCDYCAFGKYQNAVGQTSCEDCGPGQWSTLGVCRDCWPGMYQHENIATGVCHHCVPGKYNLEYGKKLQSDCKDCDIGTYQDQNGYASTAAAAEIRSPCKNCAAGSYQDQQGQTSPLCVSFFFIFHF
jgi:hypothetical protein